MKPQHLKKCKSRSKLDVLTRQMLFKKIGLTNFVSPEMPKARATETGFNLIIVHFYIIRFQSTYWKIFYAVIISGNLKLDQL